MGWTNSVLIFHDDDTFILQEEIPPITVPYIDNMPLKGPKSQYKDKMVTMKQFLKTQVFDDLFGDTFKTSIASFNK